MERKISDSDNSNPPHPRADFSSKRTLSGTSSVASYGLLDISMSPVVEEKRCDAFDPGSDDGAHAAYHHVPLYAVVENTLRAWGLATLHVLGVAIGRLFRVKRPRVFSDKNHFTLIQNRRAALLASLLHFLPVAGTAIIARYIFTDFFVGDQLEGQPGFDKHRLWGLQFAAKVHELTMVSTLTTVVFTIVRHELAVGDGVSLAFLTSGLLISRISFLWSKDFVALCRAQYSSLFKKVLFLDTIILCLLLSVAVAPASATALVPTRRLWNAGGTKIWLNGTQSQIFPTLLNESHTLGKTCSVSGSHYECPSAHWQGIQEGFFSKLPLQRAEYKNRDWEGIWGGEPVVTGRRFDFKMNLSTVLDGADISESDSLAADFRSTSWSPHVAVDEALTINGYLWHIAVELDAKYKPVSQQHRYSYRSYDVVSSDVPSPIAHTMCLANFNHTGNDEVWVPRLAELRNHEWPIWEATLMNSTQIRNWAFAIANSTRPELLWFDLPQDWSEQASIGAAISLPTTEPNQVWGCIVDARWATISINATKWEYFLPNDDEWMNWTQWDEKSYTRVNIDPSFAQYTNPRLSTSNSTVFEELVVSAGLLNEDDLRPIPLS